MANKTFQIILISFIIVVMAVAFLTSIADSVSLQTSGVAVTNESLDISSARSPSPTINESVTFTITNYPGATGVGNETITGFVIYNNTAGTGAATVTTDYTFNTSTGVITLVNSDYWNATDTNATSVDYTYYHSDYIG